jgi:hypothetical protein
MVDLRLSTIEPSANGTHTAAKPDAKTKVKRKAKPKPAPASAAQHNPAVKVWATFGVGFMLVLSAGLNG